MLRAARIWSLGTAIAMFACAGRAWAQADEEATIVPADAPPAAEPDGLAGDWLGLKPALAKAGVMLSSHYVSELAWNYAGGARSKVDHTAQFDIGAVVDLRRLAGIPGQVHVLLTNRHGRQLDQVARLGTLLEVQEIYGRGQTWRITDLWYEATALRGALRFKFGRTTPSEDFAVFSCQFQNLTFCGAQSGNTQNDYWYNRPVGQWGGRVRFDRANLSFQLGAYEVNPNNLSRRFTLSHRGARGALLPIQLGLTTGAGGGHVGSYQIGAWVSIAPRRDVLRDVAGGIAAVSGLPQLERSSSYGFWVSAEQQLSGHSAGGESVSGLSVFLKFMQSDIQTSPIENQLIGGLFFRRVIPNVPKDEIGFAVGRTHINRRLSESEQFSGKPPRGSEYVAELYYGFQPLRYLEVRPNVQWVHNPGGQGDRSDVGVLGLKSILTF